jgi:hypothetical protein
VIANKIVEGSVVAVRAKLLLDKMREVAEEIRDGSLTPGTGRAIDGDNSPVCAFGHAASRAAKEAKVHLGLVGGNYTCLAIFLNGDYDSSVPYDDMCKISWEMRRIEQSNDSVFSTGAFKALADDGLPAARERVANVMKNVADIIEDILQPTKLNPKLAPK